VSAGIAAGADHARRPRGLLCSLAGDLRVSQTVDGVKGCHMMLAKSCL
jgi:acetamidase/formamidase